MHPFYFVKRYPKVRVKVKLPDDVRDKIKDYCESKAFMPYGEILQNNEKVDKIIEKPDIFYLVNVGVYVINKSILKNIKKNKKLEYFLTGEGKLNKKIKANYFINQKNIALFVTDIFNLIKKSSLKI
mgnify:CR=1 FL=1